MADIVVVKECVAGDGCTVDVETCVFNDTAPISDVVQWAKQFHGVTGRLMLTVPRPMPNIHEDIQF